MQDEDDYLSSKFLAVDEEKKRVVGKKREPSQIKNQVPVKKMMMDNLEAGIQAPISADNKGFQLLKKFGYSGGGLGKDGRGTESSVPVVIRDSKDKIGIGSTSIKERKEREYKAMICSLELRRKCLAQDFTKRMKFKDDLRRLKQSTNSAENCLQNLDLRHGVVEHSLWPKPELEELSQQVDDDDTVKRIEGKSLNTSKGDDDDDNIDAIMDALSERLYYLRDKYFFCLFCGCTYKDAVDMEENCPGIYQDSH